MDWDSKMTENHPINPVKSGTITPSLWISAILVGLQAFLFGYVFSCMNSCIVLGDNNDAEQCYNKTDTSCPKGSLLTDLSLTDIEIQLTVSLLVKLYCLCLNYDLFTD